LFCPLGLPSCAFADTANGTNSPRTAAKPDHRLPSITNRQSLVSRCGTLPLTVVLVQRRVAAECAQTVVPSRYTHSLPWLLAWLATTPPWTGSSAHAGNPDGPCAATGNGSDRTSDRAQPRSGIGAR
jgi:hypothetical protein